LRNITTLVFEPEQQNVTYTERVPFITMKNVSYFVPSITYIDKDIITQSEVTRDEIELQEIEYEVDKTVKVPVEIMRSVMVQVPTEVDKVVLIKQAMVELVKMYRLVPQIEEEIIPDPPCHWHSIEHSHGVEVGKMHKHNM